jgi:riboflavin synthase
MFTGIIEEVGKIAKIEKSGGTWTFTVNAPKICKDSEEGDSIAIDGVCLSVTDVDKETFKVQAVPETLERTTLLSLEKNTKVNLERAAKPTDRLGGHILTGHIDGVGEILEKSSGETFTLKIESPLPLMKYIVPNGSIGIDGISLTVKEVEKSSFKATIIPYTTFATTIKEKKINDKVNLETDILAKYVQKITSEKKEPVTIDYLKEKGFL